MDLARELAGIVGEPHVLTGGDVMAGYLVDWTRRYQGAALCVVSPAAVAEVAAVVGACGRAGAAIIPQGGNTGLVGGSVPWRTGTDRPAVVLSTRRLRGLGPVDELARQVTAGAGVTIAELHGHARAAGLSYGVDLAARDSATVGGTIATNAGGVLTVRYGYTRAQLTGIEAVLADGAIVTRLAGLAADNSGYDIAGLLAGSEGTLGVITAARLRLWPAETDVTTVLAGVDGIAAAAALYAQIRASIGPLRAAEYFEADGLALVRELTGLPLPLHRPHPAYLLVEAAAEDISERLARLAALADAAVAVDRADRGRLWAYRERQPEAISAAGIPHKLDVAIPIRQLAAFRAELPGAVGPHRAIIFAHLGVGNLHINVLGPDPDDDSVDDAVLRLAVAYGGTISAEHGIGRAKARWLPLSRTAAEIGLMRAVRSALDPAGLLNPGVLC
jgi:FAD/FMN-containing dehydrogenase